MHVVGKIRKQVLKDVPASPVTVYRTKPAGVGQGKALAG
jgi:hypothetical protein